MLILPVLLPLLVAASGAFRGSRRAGMVLAGDPTIRLDASFDGLLRDNWGYGYYPSYLATAAMLLVQDTWLVICVRQFPASADSKAAGALLFWYLAGSALGVVILQPLFYWAGYKLRYTLVMRRRKRTE